MIVRLLRGFETTNKAERQAKIPNFGQQAVQGGLVGDKAAKPGHGWRVGPGVRCNGHSFEPIRPTFVKLALHLNLVSRGGYHQSFTGQNTTVDHQTNRGAFLYNSLFPISVEFDTNRRVDMIFFKFRTSRIGELFRDSVRVFKDLFEDDTPLSYHSTIGHRMNKLIVELFKVNDDTYDPEALFMYRGMEIFSKMSASLDNLKSRDELNGLHPEDYNRLQRIKSELLSNFEEKTSITELAEHHGVSVSKLKRDFKSLFGMSVYRFYNHSRMDEAYRRLSTGEYSVTEVGYDLGYSNLSKFSEMFKRMKGISPSQALP